MNLSQAASTAAHRPAHDPPPARADLVVAAAELLASMELDPAARDGRLAAIGEEIDRTGTYTLTREELVHGARLAWYNSNRCIARHLWRSLHVFDARGVNSGPGVVDALRAHLAFATNGGEVRNAITVFAPRPPQGPDPVRIVNHQLVQFAGFRSAGGGIVGDPANAAFTQQCLEAGWTPASHGPFVPLPWMVHIAGGLQPPVDALAQEPGLAPLVAIAHPENPAVERLGIHWYPVPALADMALVVGGIVFPCAPFNGHYMVTEIASRDLADRERYDLLPAVATSFGWSTADERTLWRDRAVVELNRAVLHSFDKAGVRISDHHALTAAFDRFCRAEARAGRTVTGDWDWLVPPTSGGLTAPFHRTFDGTVVRHTNFLYQAAPDAKPLRPTGGGCPYHL